MIAITRRMASASANAAPPNLWTLRVVGDRMTEAWASQCTTRQGISNLTTVKNRHAIDEHEADSRRNLRRVLVSRVVDDGIRIKDRDVGKHTRFEHPAIVDADALCGERRHLPNRKLQRDHGVLAHVPTENPGKRSEASRVATLAPLPGGVRAHRTCILSNRHPRLLHRISKCV